MNALLANPATESHRTKYFLCAHWDRLAVAIENIFPHKTALNLANISGLQVRACFRFLSRRSALSSDAVVALLDTPHGPEILRALMGDSQERWWLEFRLMWERERRLREIEDMERQLKAIDDERALEVAAAHGRKAFRPMGPAGAHTTTQASSILVKGRRS